MRKRAPVVLSPALLLLATASAEAQVTPSLGDDDQSQGLKQDTYFDDVTLEYGVDFVQHPGTDPEVGGSGAAWIDYDDDGDEDLLALSMNSMSILYRNDGDKFTDATAGSGIAPHDAICVSAADYDGDGLSDLYIGCHGDNQLYHNEGGGVFVDKAPELGVTGNDGWTHSTTFADWDLDGDVDLYVGDYVTSFNFPYHYGAPNLYFENMGTTTVWAERAAELGIDTVDVFGPSVPGYSYVSPEGEETAGCTLVVCSVDADQDGDPDLQVGNDFGLWVVSQIYYRNDIETAGTLAFTDLSEQVGFDEPGLYCMGMYATDYDHDGDLDWYMTSIGASLLLRNDDGIFTDVTFEAGPAEAVTGDGFALTKITSWAVLWEDLDHDSWEDLIVVNGYVPAYGFLDNKKRIKNSLWKNLGDGTFGQIDPFSSGIADLGPGRGIPKVDLNSDGFLDAYLTNNGASLTAIAGDTNRLYLGTGEFDFGDWLELDLTGRISNPDAYGARVYADAGGQILHRQCNADPVFLSAPSPVVHFGLGDVDVVDQLTIMWPSGIRQDMINVPVDQRMQVLEPAVTVTKIGPMDYTAETLTMTARVQNHTQTAEAITLKWELRLADDTLLTQQSVGGVLPGGTTQDVAVSVSVPAATYAAVTGQDCKLLVTSLASGSWEQEMETGVMP